MLSRWNVVYCIDNVDMELVIYVETGRNDFYPSDTLNGKVNVISDWDFSGFIYSGVHWIDMSAHATLYKLEVQEGLYCVFCEFHLNVIGKSPSICYYILDAFSVHKLHKN